MWPIMTLCKTILQDTLKLTPRQAEKVIAGQNNTLAYQAELA